jgi:hypothetical protein
MIPADFGAWLNIPHYTHLQSIGLFSRSKWLNECNRLISPTIRYNSCVQSLPDKHSGACSSIDPQPPCYSADEVLIPDNSNR